MNNLYDEKDVSGILERIGKVNPESKGLWGKMNAAQMMAHIHIAMESARGNNNMKRAFMGRIIGPLMKPGVLGPKPLPKSTPTDTTHIFPPDVNFEESRAKAIDSVKKFYTDGPAKCTTHHTLSLGILVRRNGLFYSGST